MNKLFYILSLLCLFFSCDTIDESNRYIDQEGSKPDTIAKYVKNVLLEDFTGQQCINCPTATQEAERLQHLYDDRLIVVGIHAGNQSMSSFQTEAGNAYRETLYPEGDGVKGGYPAGMFDRASFGGSLISKTVSKWSDFVKARMETEAKMSLSLISRYDEETNSIIVTSTVNAASEMSDLQLQLWVIEDTIIAPQIGQGSNYKHNHVLRGAVNGIWGEPITTKVGDVQYTSKTYVLDQSWNTKNMKVVGFVYDKNTKEILQSAQTVLVGTVKFIKKVLLEDFTGQQCINCPTATQEAERLQNLYDNRLIVVGIHAGNQSMSSFQTEAGNAYRETLYPEGDGVQGGYPAGMFDRASFGGSLISKTVSKWSDFVKARMETEAKAGLSLTSSYNEETNSIVITSTISATSAMDLQLQLWVIEDKIIAPQIGQGSKYVHNHVLRGAVNGIWGEPVTTKNGNVQYISGTYALDESWEPKNMQVVGFVYNRETKEVLQVDKVKILNK